MLARNMGLVNRVLVSAVIDNFNLDRTVTEREPVRKLESYTLGARYENPVA